MKRQVPSGEGPFSRDAPVQSSDAFFSSSLSASAAFSALPFGEVSAWPFLRDVKVSLAESTPLETACTTLSEAALLAPPMSGGFMVVRWN